MGKKSSFSPVLFFAFVYALFIVYGTLIPFNLAGERSFLNRIPDIQWSPFLFNDGSRTSISDVVQNIMLFVPLGLLVIFSLSSMNPIIKVIVVILSGTLLSAFVEFSQLFTTDRTTSVTDLITNTIGTSLGVLLAWFLKRIWQKVKGIHKLEQLIAEDTFIPAFFLLIIICVEFFQPFDFSINISLGYSKLKAVLSNLFNLKSTFPDCGFIFFLYSLMAYYVALFVKNYKSKLYLFASMILLSCMVVLIESVQFIIISRSPEVNDMIVGLLGVCTGFIFFNIKWSLPVQLSFVIIYICAVFCKLFFPFEMREAYLPMNLLPFISEYNQTTLTSLGNTIETLIIYVFGGYFLTNTLKKSTGIRVVFLIFFILLIPTAEFIQGLIKTRYPDITDVILGYISLFTGMYLGLKGEALFRGYLIESLRGNSKK